MAGRLFKTVVATTDCAGCGALSKTGMCRSRLAAVIAMNPGKKINYLTVAHRAKGKIMSSYDAARKSFEDAKELIKPPARDPVQRDLLNGLTNLTSVVEADLQAVKHKIEHLERLIVQFSTRR
jgi:hypothetical protein